MEIVKIGRWQYKIIGVPMLTFDNYWKAYLFINHNIFL